MFVRKFVEVHLLIEFKFVIIILEKIINKILIKCNLFFYFYINWRSELVLSAIFITLKNNYLFKFIQNIFLCNS